jgi:hypothetical protein
VVDHIGILKHFIHRGINRRFIVMMIDGRTDDICLFFRCDLQFSQNLTGEICPFMGMVFIMGLVFELPLLAWLMSKLGLINKAFLKKYRKVAVAVLLVLAAAITPTGDPFTLSIVFVPLYALYELSIKVVRDAEPEIED